MAARTLLQLYFFFSHISHAKCREVEAFTGVQILRISVYRLAPRSAVQFTRTRGGRHETNTRTYNMCPGPRLNSIKTRRVIKICQHAPCVYTSVYFFSFRKTSTADRVVYVTDPYESRTRPSGRFTSIYLCVYIHGLWGTSSSFFYSQCDFFFFVFIYFIVRYIIRVPPANALIRNYRVEHDCVRYLHILATRSCIRFDDL